MSHTIERSDADHAQRVQAMTRHLAQAVVNLELAVELEQRSPAAATLPKHMAIGHLAQAADIILPVDKALANQIRTERLLLS